MTALTTQSGNKSPDEKEKLAEINKNITSLLIYDQYKRCFVFATFVTYMGIWIGFAILQSKRSGLKAEQILCYERVLETVAFVTCVVSLLCAVASIAIYNKKKNEEKKLQELNEEELKKSQAPEEEKLLKLKELQELKEKNNNNLEKKALYADTLASFMIVAIELLAILEVWGAISDVNKFFRCENLAMNYQGISDTIANVVCFGVALTFLYITVDEYKKNKNDNHSKKGVIAAGIMTIGGFLILIRKVLTSLEATNTINYTDNIGKELNTLPLGLILGIVGMSVLLIGYGMSMYLSHQEIKDRLDKPDAKGTSCGTPVGIAQ